MADPIKHILWTVKAMLPEIIEEQKRDPRQNLLVHILGRIEGGILSQISQVYGYKETCEILGIKGIRLTDTSMDMTDREWSEIWEEISKAAPETLRALGMVNVKGSV